MTSTIDRAAIQHDLPERGAGADGQHAANVVGLAFDENRAAVVGDAGERGAVDRSIQIQAAAMLTVIEPRLLTSE